MESCSWVSSTSIGRERVISELTRGREIADKLRLMLRETRADGVAESVLPAPGLIQKILDSFTESISILSTNDDDSDEVSHLPELINSPGRKSEGSGESCKTPVQKDRRGCYKRRKTSVTWSKESSSLIEDGHAWRKYGQKVILNAKHPRNYFRCTHKFDQGCQATKQVQKISDDPSKFKTTYHGHHTCKNLLKDASHQIVMDATEDSSIIWSFKSVETENKPNNDLGNPNDAGEIKKQLPHLSDDDYLLFHHQLTQGPFDDTHLTAFSSGSDVISSDVYSCTTSTRMDMEDIMCNSGFEDFLEF